MGDANLNYCPKYTKAPTRKRFVRSTERVHGTTAKLWPGSKITAGVTVRNTMYDSNFSNLIEFTTSDGGNSNRMNLLYHVY